MPEKPGAGGARGEGGSGKGGGGTVNRVSRANRTVRTETEANRNRSEPKPCKPKRGHHALSRYVYMAGSHLPLSEKDPPKYSGARSTKGTEFMPNGPELTVFSSFFMQLGLPFLDLPFDQPASRPNGRETMQVNKYGGFRFAGTTVKAGRKTPNTETGVTCPERTEVEPMPSRV